MILRNLKTPMLLLALFLTVLITTPSQAEVGFLDADGGAIYSSPKAIGDAQAVLVKEELLAPGSFHQGAWDDPTARAIRAFQGEHFLRSTGEIDSETMAMLESHGKSVRLASSGLHDPVPQDLIDRVRRDRDRQGGAGRVVLARNRIATPRQESGTMERTDSGRTMPSTDSPVAFLAAVGGILMLAGLALVFVRRG